MTRHVVPSREVYHLWAQGNTNTGKDGPVIYAHNSTRSVSFSGASAYSYSALIGRIVHNKRKGRAYLVSIRTWSITTSKHQNYLKDAIPEDERVFGVSDLTHTDTVSDHKAHIAEYKRRIASAALSAKRARISWNIESHQSRVVNLTQELADYCAYFGIRAPKINVDTLREDLEALKAKEAEERRAREMRQRINNEERLAEWAMKATDWRNGMLADMPRGYPDCLLRANTSSDYPADEVETSKGARVPYDVARNLFSEWLNGTVEVNDSVGPYKVTRVDDGDSLTIGCHVITMAEARRFAIQEEWIDAA